MGAVRMNMDWAYALTFIAFALLGTACFVVSMIVSIRVTRLVRDLTDQLLAIKNPWVHQAYLQQTAQREAAVRGQEPEGPEYDDDDMLA